MLPAPDERMNANPWSMTQTSIKEKNVMIEPINEKKQQLMITCSPTLTLSNTTTNIGPTTPILPSIGSISPANTTPASRFRVVGSSRLVTPLKREYCRLQGCANIGNMHGSCHDHLHGASALQFPSPNQTPFVQTTNPLPSLVLSPGSQPHYLPSLHTVVPTQSSRSARDCQSVSVSAYPSLDTSTQPTSPIYSTTPVTHSNRSPIFIEPSTYLFAPLITKPRAIGSPAPSSTWSTGTYRAMAKCRREGCTNSARRKGLCMDHGGRHFCKMAGCKKCAHRGGFCISHGGGRRCGVVNCTKSAQSGGICYSHGGGKRCATEGCTHAARSGGFCIKHGKQQQQRENYCLSYRSK